MIGEGYGDFIAIQLEFVDIPIVPQTGQEIDPGTTTSCAIPKASGDGGRRCRHARPTAAPSRACALSSHEKWLVFSFAQTGKSEFGFAIMFGIRRRARPARGIRLEPRSCCAFIPSRGEHGRLQALLSGIGWRDRGAAGVFRRLMMTPCSMATGISREVERFSKRRPRSAAISRAARRFVPRAREW